MIVTGRVTAILQKDIVVRHLLGFAAGHIAVALLGHYVRDEAFGRLEVIGNLFGLVFSAVVFEYRSPLPFPRCRILLTHGMHDAGVQRHIDLLCRQVDVVIGHLG